MERVKFESNIIFLFDSHSIFPIAFVNNAWLSTDAAANEDCNLPWLFPGLCVRFSRGLDKRQPFL